MENEEQNKTTPKNSPRHDYVFNDGVDQSSKTAATPVAAITQSISLLYINRAVPLIAASYLYLKLNTSSHNLQFNSNHLKHPLSTFLSTNSFLPNFSNMKNVSEFLRRQNNRTNYSKRVANNCVGHKSAPFLGLNLSRKFLSSEKFSSTDWHCVTSWQIHAKMCPPMANGLDSTGSNPFVRKGFPARFER